MNINKLIIHTDGAADPNPGPSAIGATIKDNQGKLITTISQNIGCSTNNKAEYIAIITALKEAINIGATHIDLKSDSELVVRQITGIYQVKNAELKPLYQEVKHLQKSFEEFSISHILRKRNKEADRLTRKALNLVANLPPDKSYRLIIKISQTSDEEIDIVYLRRLLAILKEFPGQDNVALRVTNEGRTISLKLSNTHINYCPELHQRLVELVGEDALSLEQLDSK